MPSLTPSQRAFLTALIAATVAPILGAGLFEPIAPSGPSSSALVLAVIACGVGLWLGRHPDRE